MTRRSRQSVNSGSVRLTSGDNSPEAASSSSSRQPPPPAVSSSSPSGRRNKRSQSSRPARSRIAASRALDTGSLRFRVLGTVMAHADQTPEVGRPKLPRNGLPSLNGQHPVRIELVEPVEEGGA